MLSDLNLLYLANCQVQRGYFCHGSSRRPTEIIVIPRLDDKAFDLFCEWVDLFVLFASSPDVTVTQHF